MGEAARPPTISAEERIARLFEEFQEFGGDIQGRNPIGFPGYNPAPGDAVRIGLGVIDGRPVVAAVFDFSYLGGSMGEASGERLATAMERARQSATPFLLITSTGGARMQEGMAALAQMPRTIAASAALAASGVPRISVLCHPTTGGVYAAVANAADLILAEDGATIGFAGPRVAEALSGEKLPQGSHTAAAAHRHGLVDATFRSSELRSLIARLLHILGPSRESARARDTSTTSLPPARSARAWDEYLLARHPDRPSPRRLIEAMCQDHFEMRGDRSGVDDSAVVAAFARFEDRPVVIVAFDRRPPNAAGYRKAVRAITTAGRLNLPLVSLVDTPGADPRYGSEYAGLASAIEQTFESMLTVRSPVTCIVSGEGGSGGALALACGDRVAMLEHSVFSVIAPEGAAEILHRDTSRAPELADQLRTTSADVVALGIADDVIPEPPGGAHTDLEATASSISRWLRQSLSEVRADPKGRAARFANLRPLVTPPRPV